MHDTARYKYAMYIVDKIIQKRASWQRGGPCGSPKRRRQIGKSAINDFIENHKTKTNLYVQFYIIV